MLYDYITTCSNTSEVQKNSLRNSYCEETYGQNSINASMLDNTCFKDIDYTKIDSISNSASNSASNIKNFISSNCSNISNQIYENLIKDNCQLSDNFNQNLPGGKLDYNSNIYQKLQYTQYINNLNGSCNPGNIYDNCCPNNDNCVNGIPSQCSASCSPIFKNTECNTFFTSLFSDDTDNASNIKNFITECNNPLCSASNVPNCLPDICTSASNIPHEGCMPRDCTSASNVPYEGCINVSCTDTNTPYEGCINVPCNEALYWDCTDYEIDYTPPNLIDFNYDEILQNCSNAQNYIDVRYTDEKNTIESESNGLLNSLSLGVSLFESIPDIPCISPEEDKEYDGYIIAAKGSLFDYNLSPSAAETACNFESGSFDALREIDSNCSGILKSGVEAGAVEIIDTTGMQTEVADATGIDLSDVSDVSAVETLKCTCKLKDYYNRCSVEASRISNTLEDDKTNLVGTVDQEIAPYISGFNLYDNLKYASTHMCSIIANSASDSSEIIDRINSINASFMTDTEYRGVTTELEYYEIQSKILEYGNYLSNQNNWNDVNFQDIKNKIDGCIRHLEEGDIGEFKDAFTDDEGGCQMAL